MSRLTASVPPLVMPVARSLDRRPPGLDSAGEGVQFVDVGGGAPVIEHAETASDLLAVCAGVGERLRVTTTANEQDAAMVRALGAEVVARDALPTGVDAVLDTPGTGTDALMPVRDGGTLVTVAGPVAGERGTRSVQVRVSQLERRGERLAALSELAAKGKLVLPRVLPLPLAEVAQAHERLAAGGVSGRLILVP